MEFIEMAAGGARAGRVYVMYLLLKQFDSQELGIVVI